MRVTRIDIFGFKSFVERFVLNLDERLIGVVGPNGCGKSNIVDALRWVLGETHAKQLRGNVLEDVIFNGSESRRPLGMAEVSITVRPAEGWAASGIAENNEEADLADIDVPTEDQDSVSADEVVCTNGAQVALSHGDCLRDLVRAIPGLLDVAEIQLTRRLYRSGESEYFINKVPCRLRDLKDLYRVLGLGARGLSIVQQGQIGELISKKPTERRELLEEAAGISGFRVKIEAAERSLERTSANMARLSDLIDEVEKQVAYLRRQASRAKRRDELKHGLREVDEQLFQAKAASIFVNRKEIESQLDKAREELNSFDGNLALLAKAETEHRAKMEEEDSLLDVIRRRKDELSTKLQAIRTRKNEVLVKAAEVKGRLHVLSDRLRVNQDRTTAANAEIERREKALSTARDSLVALENRKKLAKEELEAATSGANQELALVRQGESELVDSVKQLSAAVADERVRIASLESEVRALSAQLAPAIRKREGGASKNVREIFKRESVQALLSGISVSDEFKTPLEAALGDRAIYVVANDVLALRASVEKEGCIDTCSLGVVDKCVLPTGLSSLLRESFSSRRLIEKLEIREGFSNAFDALIGNVLIAKDIEEAVGLFDEVRQKLGQTAVEGLCVVTLSGELLRNWGWSVAKEEVAFVSLSLRVEEQTKAHNVAKTRFNELSEMLAKKKVELEKVSRRRIELDREKERRTREFITSFTSESATLNGLIQFETARIKELRSETLDLEGKRKNIVSEEEKLSSQQREIELAIEAREREDSTQEKEIDVALKTLDEEMRLILDRRNAFRLELAQIGQRLDVSRRSKEDKIRSCNAIQLRVERSGMELSMLIEDIKARYAEREWVLPSEEEIVAVQRAVEKDGGLERHVQSLNEQVLRLRSRLEKEGEVDKDVLVQFEAESKRLEEMCAQREDLEAANSTLAKTIKELKDVSRRRFMETFEFVNARFSELVPRLFGGGAGHLELIESDDPLASGVEIVVRPPGKKLASMDLLSGGEKALVAVAVLVAMFLYRPGPICVLDEVDAPLDDANLDRFLRLVADISERTQFLIITHNKDTMAAMGKLVGITMQEKGVTKALSVSLEQAAQSLQFAVGQ
ncbi:MAG: AAA family ATPase [Deltaproteobacteria bacterium]|nr:AAA family ATPase [Deltaproteobacteria bacterium]